MRRMRDQEKQAWSLVEGMTTQIITLATGTIVLTATLFERVFPMAEATCTEKIILFASWMVLGISVLSGVLVYMRAIYLLGKENKEREEKAKKEEEKKEQKQDEEMLKDTRLLCHAKMQLYTFLLGIVLFVIYMYLNVFN